MSLKLKFLTCPECKGHSYTSYSSNGITANVNCRCGHKYKAEFEYKTVDYPDVTILGKTFEKLSVEKEIFYPEPFGVNVEFKFHKESHYNGRKDIRHNATEFHYLYNSRNLSWDDPRVAVESYIHYQGGTLEISHIKSIVITKATKKYRNH